jgi:cysteine-rich repeat protein
VNVTLPYANPYPTTWPQTMNCTLDHVHVTRVNGGVRYGYSYLNSYVAASDTYTWSVATHAPANIQVGGVDGLVGGAVAFDGVAPVTMTWDAVPGVTHYAVRVLGAVEGVVAKLDTTETTLAIPPDTFTRGNFYVFRVYAIQTSGDYAGGHLFEVGVPLWSARISTGWFRFSDACGDGDLDAGEDCDPGPGGSTAACDDDCTVVMCGDGFVNAAAGESCDETFDAPRCDDDTCQAPVCNDGLWDAAAEECDDGNPANGDGCSTTCHLDRCGDGTTDAPFESCDDGNRVNGDGCDAFCRPDTAL